MLCVSGNLPTFARLKTTYLKYETTLCSCRYHRLADV